jgi:hypothetical protein
MAQVPAQHPVAEFVGLLKALDQTVANLLAAGVPLMALQLLP